MSLFSERLKACRIQRGLTQKQVAEFLKIKERSFQRYESGEREPDFKTVFDIAGLLDVSVDYLLGGERGMGALRLRATRTDERLTQEEAAKAVGINVSDWKKYESGEKSLSPKHLIEISEHFGVNKDFIAGRENVFRHDEPRMDFSEKLKHHRLKKGLTQKQIAKGLNIGENLYREYENGVQDLDFETVSKLADFFGVRTSYLFDLTDERIKNSADEIFGLRGSDVEKEAPLFFICLLEMLHKGGLLEVENRLKGAFVEWALKKSYGHFIREDESIKNSRSIFIESLMDGSQQPGDGELYKAIAEFVRYERKNGDKKFCQEAAATLGKAIGVLLSDDE